MISVGMVRRAALAATVMVLAACGARQGGVATLAPDELYASGTAAFEARKWGRAIERLEPFANANLGDPRVPKARMMLAEAHMARREYITAAAEYQRVAADFPADPLAQTARFGVCEAYYRLSPKPPLDQEYTYAALAHCNSVAAMFPGTTEATQAAAFVAKMQEKLARKLYDNGDFYFRRRAYDAAVIYFEDVLAQYATTRVAPLALMRLYESYTRIGYKEEAQEARERLLRDYPESPEARALPPPQG
jgi:outer membrane protein assembly factor BamD